MPHYLSDDELKRTALWHRLLRRSASESATLCHGDGPDGQGDRRRRSFVLPILLSNSYCARITKLYAPTPTLALKFSPSFPPGLAVVSKLSPLMKLGS